MLEKLESLKSHFYSRSTSICARELVGCLFATYIDTILRVGRIVETEAYCGPEDPACHAACGRTKRNGSLFGPVGHLYVYISYGIHTCVNIVCHTKEIGSGGVLIRALEPLVGIEFMEKARGRGGVEVTNGPGKVGQAMGITRAFDGHSLIGSPYIRIYHDPDYIPEIRATPRIGISKGKEHLWRFIDVKSKYISKYL